MQLEVPEYKVFPVEEANQVFENICEGRVTARAIFKFGSQISSHTVDNQWNHWLFHLRIFISSNETCPYQVYCILHLGDMRNSSAKIIAALIFGCCWSTSNTDLVSIYRLVQWIIGLVLSHSESVGYELAFHLLFAKKAFKKISVIIC